jgi:hypothetical protein
VPRTESDCGSRTSDFEGLASQEPQGLSFKNSENGGLRAADSEAPEPQNLPPSKKEKRNTELSQKEVSQSVVPSGTDRRTDDDEEELEAILESCELYCFPRETAQVLESAVERLFYSDSFRSVTRRCRKRRPRQAAPVGRLSCKARWESLRQSGAQRQKFHGLHHVHDFQLHRGK